jgi:hypothetical protein
MRISRNQAILLGVAALLVAIVAFVGGRGFNCGCTHEPAPIVLGIDAGPGEDEINARLDAALVAGAVRIEEVERKFTDDLAAFDANQAVEYERLRGGDDLEAAALYLSRWSRERRRLVP